MQETQVQSLGLEDTLEKEMATHSSILAWRILWTEEPDRLQFMVLLRTATDTFTFLYTKSRLGTMKPKQSHERLTFSPLTYLFCHHINLNSILSIISIKRTFSKMLEHPFLQNWFHNLEKIESNKKMNFIVIDSVGQTFFLILPDSSPKV